MGGLSNSRGNSQKSAPAKNSHGNSKESVPVKKTPRQQQECCIRQTHPRHHLDDPAIIYFHSNLRGMPSYLHGSLKLCHPGRSPRRAVDLYPG